MYSFIAKMVHWGTVVLKGAQGVERAKKKERKKAVFCFVLFCFCFFFLFVCCVVFCFVLFFLNFICLIAQQADEVSMIRFVILFSWE